ncbi:hypothetical protein IVB27_35525 [Bradyrhizobium sp. 197]|uniref:hypothetical protein n=1 Tax=Bradyrhizobium sp. 197 TaxID=2782663 RepID=UPI001FFB2077|nr:hypothetical protein [Bradyrhizobium sp. 197]MCK1479912.1 hypothetical protein [Bradyrhizobium sp. 197]
MIDRLSEFDLDALTVLIDCLETTPTLSNEDVEHRYRAHIRNVFPAMLEDGKSYGEASGGTMSFLNRPDARDYIISIHDDLGANVAILSGAFAEYLDTGEPPAPFYAWRICIILAKGKMRQLELRFLNAWVRHFEHRGVGQRYKILVQRRTKLSATSSLIS